MKLGDRVRIITLGGLHGKTGTITGFSCDKKWKVTGDQTGAVRAFRAAELEVIEEEVQGDDRPSIGRRLRR